MRKSNLILASWRSPPPRDAGLRGKIALSILLILSLSAFRFVLLRPFSRSELQVLIVGPSRLGPLSLADVNELDLPMVLSAANAHHVRDGILASCKPILIRSQWEDSLARLRRDCVALCIEVV